MVLRPAVTVVSLCALCVLCAAWVPGAGAPTGVTVRLVAQGAGAVRIPPGAFVMGSDPSGLAHGRALCAREEPLALRLCPHALSLGDEPCDGALIDAERGDHTVWLPAFGIDRTEVTVGSYARCVTAGACAAASVAAGAPLFGGVDQPAVGVSWNDARDYCQWAGGRLPSEAEWERAARGADGRPWPWGWQWDPRRANHGASVPSCRDASDGYAVTAPVGAFPDGASPEGVLDLAGNVMEWVADAWAPESAEYPLDRQVDPRGADHGADRMVRGGAWDTVAFTLRTTFRIHLPAGSRTLDLGFRCAWDTR